MEWIELYKHLNNSVVNAYWEARLPKGYNKPGQNASSHEVESFIRDKYVYKRWIDLDVSADPATLWKNDKKKFDKYMKKLTKKEEDGGEEEDSEEDRKKKRKDKKKKKRAKDESEEEFEQPAPVKGPTIIAAPSKTKVPVSIDNLISFDSLPSSAPSGTTQSGFDGFSDFHDATPAKDGFEEF